MAERLTEHAAADRRAGSRVLAGVAIVVVLVWALPGAAELLAFDRSEILDGAWWRAVTGQLAHWDGHHLLWNIGGMILLGLWFREPGGVFWAASGIGAALAIALGLLVERGPLEHYRGLSGVLYGWFLAAVIAHADWSRWLRGLIGGVVVLWALAEALSLGGMVRTLPTGTPVHAMAHVYGMAGALLAVGLVRLARVRSVSEMP